MVTKNKCDLMSNLEQVVSFISELNIESLSLVLNEKNLYNELPKMVFISILGNLFDNLKEKGITTLLVKESICAGCQAGARVKLFISKETKRFLAFAIDVNDTGEVIDIFSCNMYTIKHFPDYQDYMHISFDTDDNSFFETPPLKYLPK